MPHTFITNRAELNRLFANFCHFWTEGLHVNVQMTTKGNGRVMAQFEFELKNQTTSSQLDLLASGEVNLKVNHGDTRDTSQFRSSFSQLHGQDGSVDESDCPTTPKEKQWEQNVTMVDEYSSIDATANIVKPEEESVIGPMVLPGKGCCSGKVAEEKRPVTVSSASLELTPPKTNHLLSTMSGTGTKSTQREGGECTQGRDERPRP